MTPASIDTAADGDWTLVIRPRRRWFDLRLGELWEARDLTRLFVWRDFVAVHKQTILGPAWHLLQPLLTTVMFTVVFGRIASLPSDGVPHFVFYLAGTVLWNYFAACLTRNANSFGVNAGLFGKVYFPRLTVPLSIVVSSLVTFGIQLLLLVAVVAWFSVRGAAVHPTIWVLATPGLIAIAAALAGGLALLVSALTTRYRDLQQVIAFGVQLLMFATPIIYPVSAVGPRYRPYLDANPLTPLVEAFRYAFLGVGTTSLGAIGYSAIVASAVLFAGIVAFTRVEQTSADWV